MDRGKRLLRAGCTALTAALMAGCSACMIARALGLTAAWAGAYLLALLSASAVLLLRRGRGWALGAAAASVLLLGILLWIHVPRIAALVRMLPAAEGARGLDAARAVAGRSLSCLCAYLLGALLAGLLRAPSGASLALLVLLSSVIFALASDAELSLWAALPGLAAGVAAFGMPSDARSDGVSPALLVPALLLAALALMFTPGERVTWEPLERLAGRVREIVEDYVRFTEQRMAFSIGEKGYDRAGMIGESVVSMLGGPANPSRDAVMRVETDAELLLRGSIKRSYTGYSWVDDQTKARYLYYDFTHRRVREQVFDAQTTADSSAFEERAARVEMLGEGTSTLFVPAQLSDFEMGLENAVYYNSAGEIFLTRGVRAGDRYALRARVPRGEEALVQAVQERADAEDPRWEEARENYTELPPNIDSGVYAIAVELTRQTYNAAEKAFAIQNYLAQNYRYTLDGGIPEGNADFVSWFLLDSGEGYCSYFASAMAVLCRIAGLPARYVEGYAVHAQPGGETIVTGENAHAWVEVYFNGLGWVAFDPTAAARAAQGGEAGEGDADPDAGRVDEEAEPEPGDGEDLEPNQVEPSMLPSPELGATPTPDPGAPEDGEGEEEASDGEDETSDGEDGADADEPSDGGENAASESPDAAGTRNGLRWLWALLILAALAGLAWLGGRALRRRLRETDPMARTENPEDMDEAALLLYRATLTLLNQLGYAPQSGETPEAFAQRANEALKNPNYLRFVRGVARCRYSGQGADAQLVRDGRLAYAAFLRRMRRWERFRFHARRVLRGLGSTETIP